MSIRMKRKIFCIIGILVFLCGCPKEKPEPVEMTLFYSEHCSSCRQVRRELFPGILKKYGASLDFKELNTDQDENLVKLWEEVRAFDRERAFVPSVLIGGHFLVGADDVTQNLSRVIGEVLNGRRVERVPAP